MKTYFILFHLLFITCFYTSIHSQVSTGAVFKLWINTLIKSYICLQRHYSLLQTINDMFIYTL